MRDGLIVGDERRALSAEDEVAARGTDSSADPTRHREMS
jgi:hypothetical protein